MARAISRSRGGELSRSAGTSPKAMRDPSASTASTSRTLCTMIPYLMERVPAELLPVIPPRVALAEVETSTGKVQPVALSCRFSSSRTIPGCTTAVPAAASTSRRRFMCRLVSITKASPSVWPFCELPPPRGMTGKPSWRASARAASTSWVPSGSATPMGSIW